MTDPMRAALATWRRALLTGRVPSIAGASESYDERITRELGEFFGAEVRQLDGAVAAVERARKETFRPDGVTRLYGPEELEERGKRALAAYDETAAAITAAAETAVAAAETELEAIAGADPLAALPEADLVRASARAVFVKEDVARLPADALAARLRALLAGTDRVEALLTVRYLPDRVAAMTASERATLGDLPYRVQQRVADPKARERRERLERQREVGKVLAHRVSMRRRDLDGTAAQDRAGLARAYGRL